MSTPNFIKIWPVVLKLNHVDILINAICVNFVHVMQKMQKRPKCCFPSYLSQWKNEAMNIFRKNITSPHIYQNLNELQSSNHNLVTSFVSTCCEPRTWMISALLPSASVVIPSVITSIFWLESCAKMLSHYYRPYQN